MATLRTVNVSTAAGFAPATVHSVSGDAVTWHNNDQTTEHQPYPVGGKPGDWGAAIPGNNSSDQVDFGTPGTFAYTDAKNPSLKGSVVVSNLIQIGPVFGQSTPALV